MAIPNSVQYVRIQTCAGESGGVRHMGEAQECHSLYVQKWEGWTKERERRNAMKARALQRQVIGSNLQAEYIKNNQKQFEIYMENYS